jgi:flagellar FliL protein
MAKKSKEPEEAQADSTPPKKGKSKLLIILALIGAVAIGGAGSFFYFQRVAKAKTEVQKKSKHTDDADQSDEASDKGKEKGEKGEKEKSASPVAALPQDTDVKQVVEIQPFVLNLADKDDNRFLRLSVSLGLGEEGEKPDAVFIARVRNAVLAVLMTKTSVEILTPEGKSTLRKELLQALRAVTAEPQVLAIYITELIVQR